MNINYDSIDFLNPLLTTVTSHFFIHRTSGCYLYVHLRRTFTNHEEANVSSLFFFFLTLLVCRRYIWHSKKCPKRRHTLPHTRKVSPNFRTSTSTSGRLIPKQTRVLESILVFVFLRIPPSPSQVRFTYTPIVTFHTQTVATWRMQNYRFIYTLFRRDGHAFCAVSIAGRRWALQ